MRARPWIFLLAAGLCLARNAPAFDLEAFEEFLETNRTLTGARMLEQSLPDPMYRMEVGVEASEAGYFDLVSALLDPTAAELELLGDHGFVTSQRWTRNSWGDALATIWHRDLPLYISSDLILHTVHISFRETQKEIERGVNVPAITDALAAAHLAWPTLDATHAGNPQMRACLDDLDIWLTVARSLIEGSTVAPASASNDGFVNTILAAIESEQPGSLPLFNEVSRLVDFSQFKVRGYYAEEEILQRYFRCMMWLGRVDFRLSPPAPGIDVQREVVDAFLLRELLDLAGARQKLMDVEAAIRMLVGEPDNTTFEELDDLAAALALDSAADLWAPASFGAFEAELASGSYMPQAINSRIIMQDPMSAEPIEPPYSFLVLGQRFAVDSFVMGKVVYDELISGAFRGLPSVLDVLYALGNDDVVPLLQEELDLYGYAPNLEALRYLIDSYEDEFWTSSVYNHWIHALRALGERPDPVGTPPFMLTGAWQQKQMNTQAGSWTELRHDTVLYVKQSYSDGTLCSNPEGYVEPVPELYRRLAALSGFVRDHIGSLSIGSGSATQIQNHYAGMEVILGRLESIARLELEHMPLGFEDEEFLRTAFSRFVGCGGGIEDGWLAELCYSPLEGMPLTDLDAVVVDVHTQPTDESGAPVGRVLHVGTYPPQLAIVVAGCPTTDPIAFVGPVFSMRETVSSGFNRYTDGEWGGQWDPDSPVFGWFPWLRTIPPPAWSKVYSTDMAGNRYPDAPSIMAAYAVPITDPSGDGPVPGHGRGQIAWVTNSPNPFNPRTTIRFLLEGAAPVPVRVDIYDARGAHVRQLLHEDLAPRAWALNWNGTDGSGRRVASGTYFAVVLADGQRSTRKMVMVR